MSTVTPSRPGTTTTPRPASRPPSRLRRAGAVIAGIALAAAAVAVQAVALEHEDRLGNLTWTGRIGDEVVASRFSARVTGVHGAKSIQITDVTDKVEKATTSGLFVIVEVGATAHREPQKFGPPVLLAEDGKRYAATDKVKPSLTITHPYIQPGWWTEGVAVFEVPVAALTGARIVLPLTNGFFIKEANLPEVEIDLGLDDAATQRLIAGAEDVYPMGGKK
ncbi:hypothetical protein GCM10010156_53310 [Planobispora rosea]|uniref:DUF4352 domain-containing protein n=1 Tax=Planobispora rosea TaxID=35762 RepID=A0A8J3S589_PLARO|nr:hypothetical protein [Planobispora rosea]GGS88168.1 hypothetical protein GCM10010156_53310 [Planobispora rosea]GIH88601.1 hypothetical protein Pro02_70090 [Planobispora rosea]